MSDILERIKAEDKLWNGGVTSEDGWTDKQVGVFIGWYRKNIGSLERGEMFTSAFINTTSHTKNELEELWARAMLEGGDDDT